MKFLTVAAALLAVIPATLGLTINTPVGVVLCQPTQLTWSGGTGPYYLSVLPGGQTGATPLEEIATVNGTSYTWTANVQGTITISIKDSTGEEAYTSLITVQTGTTTDCITSGTSSVSSGATSTPASGSTSGSPVATSGANSASSGSATSTAASGSSTQKSAAGRLSVSSSFGVTGIMGLVGAILF